MASNGLLAALLVAAAFLAGAAISFAGIQTLMIWSGFGNSSARPATSCDPGFRLPISLGAMLGIDAVVAGIAAVARAPANNLLAAFPVRHRRPVRNLATGALYLGVGAAFPVLPTCPVVTAPGSGCADDCFPLTRAAMHRINVVVAASLAAGCVIIYINLNYLDADDGEAAAARGGRRRRRRARDD